MSVVVLVQPTLCAYMRKSSEHTAQLFVEIYGKDNMQPCALTQLLCTHKAQREALVCDSLTYAVCCYALPSLGRLLSQFVGH